MTDSVSELVSSTMAADSREESYQFRKSESTGKDRPFGRLPSLHDIREAHGVAHLGVWGLDEYRLVLRSEGFIAIPLDVAETGDRVPEGQAVSEDDGFGL